MITDSLRLSLAHKMYRNLYVTNFSHNYISFSVLVKCVELKDGVNHSFSGLSHSSNENANFKSLFFSDTETVSVINQQTIAEMECIQFSLLRHF